MLDNMRRRLARMIAPSRAPRAGARAYAAARQTRLTGGWYAPNNSADAELATSLQQLRSRSRALMRDAPFAKRAKTVVVNNVIGAGIGMQAAVEGDRGGRLDRVNDDIERVFCEWSRAEYCHTGGKLHFADIERQAFGQIFEAGEILVRLHLRAFAGSPVPLALELVEPERLAENYSAQPGATVGLYRMGVEVDTFHRAIAFWVQELHPNETRFEIARSDTLTRVPADQMFHLYLVDRWPQTRGEPWLHAVAKRLNDMDGYSEAEIVAARAAASYMGIITTPEPDTAQEDEAGPTNEFDLEPGAVKRLAPGEEFEAFSPNRPNPAMEPFMRLMLREVAAGAMTSYESLSRDYSQSNYSSSRLALIDDRDAYRTLQAWFIRSFREPLHRLWMQQAVLAGAIPSISPIAYGSRPEKFNAVQFKPRGWSWVDPTKEVDAFIKAVRAGFMTVGDVISQTGNGRDREDVWKDRAHELAQAEELGLSFDTTTKEPPAAEAPVATDPEQKAPGGGDEADPDQEPARVVPLRSATA